MFRSHSNRILLIRNAHVYDFGGGERFPVQLAKQLEQSGFNTLVVSRSPKLLNYAKLENAKHLRGWWWSRQSWSGKSALLFPIYIIWQFLLFTWYLQLILRFRPATVHPQSKDDFIAATFAGRLLGKRVIWTDHADLKYIFANHTIWYKNPVGKLAYFASKLAHAITLVSHSEQQLVEAALGHTLSAKYVVIHNGVLDTTVNPVGRPEAASTIFCATSRLVTAKGIGELIDAFKQLHSDHPDTLLWLVGDGPERAKFEAQATGDSSIVFLGHSDEPLRYVAACDIFVHPSYHEGFSISLVEAAMVGKPMIACNVGGNPEIVQDHANGLLIPDRDSETLHEAMTELLRDRTKREAYGQAGRQEFLRDFEFSRIVKERFVPLYEKH
jgi:glycosyltransferase involved in cell wall biosynthesis